MTRTDRSTVPAHLNKPEATLWRRLVDEYGIRDSGGLAILQAAMESHARARRCREAIDRDGELVDGRPHPLLLCERDSRKSYLSALKMLELDVQPAAASPGRPTTTVRRIA